MWNREAEKNEGAYRGTLEMAAEIRRQADTEEKEALLAAGYKSLLEPSDHRTIRGIRGIPDDTYRDIKIEAVSRGVSIGAYLTEAHFFFKKMLRSGRLQEEQQGRTIFNK